MHFTPIRTHFVGAIVVVVVLTTLTVVVDGLMLRQLQADESEGPGLYEVVKHGGNLEVA